MVRTALGRFGVGHLAPDRRASSFHMIIRIKEIVHSRLFEQWIHQLILTALTCFGYVFSEWIFVITKPSFLSSMGLGNKLLIALKAFILLGGLALECLVVLGIVSLLIRRKPGELILKLSSILPSAILTAFFFLLVDNFTYTVFKFGIITSSGFGRAAYALFFIALWFFAFRFFTLLLTLKVRHAPVEGGVILALLIAFLFVFPSSTDILRPNSTETSSSLPNIIIFGSDGVSADHMSVYGYARETTPYIQNFAKDALFVQNNFTNSGNTSASVISLLTGRYPTQTRVIYPPDMLSGSAATAHLPGILKSLGYYNAEFTLPHYADAYTLGMQYGFDEVNGEGEEDNTYLRLRTSGFSTNDAYFAATAFDRIAQRLLHIFFIRDALNPYDFVTKGTSELSDQQIVDSILSVFDSHEGTPVFIHAHLKGTHGGLFTPAIPTFSKGEKQDQYWMTDFYDDSILTLDALFGEMVDSLKAKGKLENTIIVVYSDHAEEWQDKLRIPLIIRFPKGEYKNLVINQAQNLDIAPTILDYLNIAKPFWMEGHSLLDSGYHNDLVISTGTMHGMAGASGWVLDTKYLEPPFYQIDYVRATQCQNWVVLDLETFEVTEGSVENYAFTCPNNGTMSSKDLLNSIINHLITHGYTIPSDLEKAVADYN